MITQPESITKLKQLFIELLINKTTKVSDVSDNSVLNATAFGVGKVAQKALKDIAIVEAKLFPDTATGDYLDRIADLYGVTPRRGATGSSTYLRIVAEPTTEYYAGVNNFVNNNGILFELAEDIVVSDFGFIYALVRSIDTGEKTNVDPASVITVTPSPAGHIAVTNEYISIGGADAESDEVFRQRIKNNLNILSISTLEYFTQLFQNQDERILRVLNLGTNDQGIRELAIVTQNGVELTQSELDDLLQNTQEYFPITDLNRFGDSVGIELVNVVWYGVNYDGVYQTDGIDFRIELDLNADADEVRKNIQINISKYLDFRFWEPNKLIEWTRLLRIVRDTEGVRHVPDNTFHPSVDEVVPVNQLPRVQKFVMRDLEGNIIYDSGGNLSPVFYPSE